MMRKPQEILQLVPKQPDWRIDWSAAEQSSLAPYIDSMRKTQQNPVWHGSFYGKNTGSAEQKNCSSSGKRCVR